MKDIPKNLTFPASARLPAEQILQLDIIAEQMDTSTGKVLSTILEDILPLFDPKNERASDLKIIQLYRAMRQIGILKSVNVEDKKRKLLGRGPDRPRGRPKKED